MGEEWNGKYFILAERNQEATVRDRKIEIASEEQSGSATITEPDQVYSVLMVSILGIQ